MDFNKLNDEQYKAVMSASPRVLVLAGPGTGKTSTLTYRIAHLIADKGVPSSRILALTFTQKAAEEMNARLCDMLAGSGFTVPPMVCTFHSFAHQLIKESDWIRWKVFGNSNRTKLDIIDEEEQSEFFVTYSEILGEKISASSISRLKNEMISVDEYAELEECDSNILEAYEAYEKYLEEKEKIDYEDLLQICVNGLENDDFFSGLSAYSHILVDEYQDTCPVQDRLLELLLTHNPNAALFAVGDDDQAIYGFRGCSSRIMLDFPTKYSNSEIYTLTKNYRSQRTIVHVANEIIEHNQERYDKRLIATSERMDPIEIYQFPSISRQALFAANEITDLVKNAGFLYSDFAILVRNNSQTEVYESVFAANEIPYIFPSVQRILKRQHMKDLMAYMKVVAGTASDEELMSILNRPGRSIGPTTIKAITGYATRESKQLFEALSAAEEYLPKAKAAHVSDFVSMIREVREVGKSVEKQVQMILEKTSYMKFLRTELQEKIKKSGYSSEVSKMVGYRMKEVELHVNWLINQSKQFDKSEEEVKTLSAFLKKLKLGGMDDMVDIKGEAVSILTMHKAKGLEWPVVFVDVNGPKVDEYTEEELRVFYVACTRAKDYMYLLYKKGNPINMGVKYIPRCHFADWDDHNEFRCSDLGTEYKIGMKIAHEMYGEGIICDVSDWIIGDKWMPGKKLCIKFADGNTRTLYTEFSLISVCEGGEIQ